MPSADSVADASGGSETNVDTTAGDGPTDDTDPTSQGDGDSSSTGEPATDSEGGEPMLVLSEDEHNFGDVEWGNNGTVTLTVSNTGTGTATGMDGASMAPFGFADGGYPGMGGDCGNTLAPDANCTVVVEFAPTDFGPFNGTVDVSYDGAMTNPSCDLLGRGIGESVNLLSNPGGETEGDPPPGWYDAGPGTWFAGNAEVDVHEGMHYIAANTGPNDSALVLRQDVDISMWSGFVDAGEINSSFGGWARSWTNNNDIYRLIVRFLDAGGGELEVWGTGWQTTGGWTLYEDSRTVPANTRSIQVELGCEKNLGMYCHAFFDAMVLRASYP